MLIEYDFVWKTPWNLKASVGSLGNFLCAASTPTSPGLVRLRKYMDVYLDCDYAETLWPACFFLFLSNPLLHFWRDPFGYLTYEPKVSTLGFWLIVDIYAGIRYWHSRAYLKPFELTGTTWNRPQRSQNGSKKLLCQLPQFFRSSIRWPWRPWVWKKVWIWILTTRFFCQPKTPRVNLVDCDFWVHGSIKVVERWLC